MSQDHGHAHSHAPANYNRAFAIGVTLNVVFASVEAVYGCSSKQVDCFCRRISSSIL